MLKAFEVTREPVHVKGIEVTLFRIQGYLDAHTAPRFESALRQAVADGCRHIVVDCARLDYISSAGLGVLIEAHRAVRTDGGEIKLAAMSAAIADIFGILGFSKMMRSFASQEDALASFEEPAGGTPK